MINRFTLGFKDPCLSLGRHVYSLINPNVAWAFDPKSTRLGDRAMETESSELFIGVDISKKRLDISNDSKSEAWSELNNDDGVS